MLDTFMVLLLLAVMAVLGCLMGFFGGRRFRPFALMAGFGGGAILVMFALSRLAPDMSLTSMPALIASIGIGLLLGIVCMLFRYAGLAVTGIAAGLVLGAGLVFCADFLLGGLIPPIVYTFLSVLIASIVALSCLSKQGTGRAFSTSILGGYIVVTAIALVVAWFAAQRGDLSRLLASSNSILSDLGILYTAMSDKTLALYVVAGLLLGIAMFALQSPYIVEVETAPGIDELGEEPFEALKEKGGRKKKQKKSRLFEDEEEFDEYDDFDEIDDYDEIEEEKERKRKKKPKAKKKKTKKRRFSNGEDFSDEDDYYDEDYDEYDDDYAELDAMIEDQAMQDEEPPHEEFDGDADEGPAFREGKKAYTADGGEQPAHGPLRPKTLPDENGFVEKAVTVDPSDIEEPTVIFEPVTDEEEDSGERKRRVVSMEEFSARKPTFKKEKTLSEEMDYDPDGSFVSRTERKGDRKKKRK